MSPFLNGGRSNDGRRKTVSNPKRFLSAVIASGTMQKKDEIRSDKRPIHHGEVCGSLWSKHAVSAPDAQNSPANIDIFPNALHTRSANGPCPAIAGYC